jgi:protein SCO1/2
MNRGAMTKRLCTSLALALSVAVLSSCGDALSRGDPPLAGAEIGGPFELVDGSGNIVRWSDFDGRYRIVYFGYAYCPDICPYDVQRMMQGYNAFKKAEPALAADVQPIFVTIDPERDTPEVVAEFTAAFSRDLVGLTGTSEQVDAAAKAFAVYYQKGEDAGNGSYLMDHSRAAYLMGRDGEPIALLPVEQSGEAVARELEKWVS